MDEFRSWFIDLWNHSIIPYLQEGAKDGIKVRKGADKSRKCSPANIRFFFSKYWWLPFHRKCSALILL